MGRFAQGDLQNLLAVWRHARRAARNRREIPERRGDPVSGWYPRFTPDAQHIVSGDGDLSVDGESIGVIGWQPVPITEDSFVFNGGPGVGVRIYTIGSRILSTVDPRELIELAGGGGRWAGRHAPSNTLIVSDGREIVGAGQPCLAADGALIYRQGDDKIEPSICLTAEAWGDGRGHLYGRWRGGPTVDVTVGPHEARAVLLDTPEGPWVLCMAGISMHLRPLFGKTGYRPPANLTGNNRNLHAHAVCIGREIRCVWQDDRGNQIRWDVSLDAPRKSLTQPTPEPDVITPDPEPEPMAYEPIPSHLDVVLEVWNRCTPQQREAHAFVAEAVAWELRQRGLDFYVNQKRGVQGDSEDAISTPHEHGAGGWAVIDIIAGFGGDNPQPVWNDATEKTIDAGTVGGGRLPRNVLGISEPPPPPQPVECNCKAEIAELERLLLDVAKVSNERLTALENKPAPAVTLPKLRAKSNGGWLGHSHDIEVVPE